MAKYMYLYSGGPGMEMDEAKRNQVMAEWEAYYGKIGGNLADPGAPFGEREAVGGQPSGVNGYTIVEAADLAAAKAMTDGHPHVAHGGSIEIVECIDMSG
ncbi:MAG: YciI family protein [Thermoplasmatota archaeon]